MGPRLRGDDNGTARALAQQASQTAARSP